ncbi:hypothetical protein LTR62_007684 [Meristemomyces frigidus]|uniref:Malic acid transport protein n=1 Tax=Meristemomyces frigidus TaxID=1508187 RepID=A0AAN7TBL7_9PEZI|nr:hypothetical protein LTR62_007684 [Meristemomyces frigidus]
MATGGVANVIYHVPYRFPGLYTIGCIFFLLNLVLFLFNLIMISCRFYLYPHTFKASFLHPTESLFIPAWVISLGTILINVTEYGIDHAGPWLAFTMRILFWTYCALAVVFSLGIYLVMWSTQTFTIAEMTPVWIFPAYPLLVIGPHAAVLADKLTGTMGLDIVIGGFIFQGIGFMVSLMIYAAFIYRLMTHKLPQESLRPGMFISVGPSGFTISGLVGMGQIIGDLVPGDFMGDGVLAGKVTRILATWAGLWLWGLAIWFFFVSCGAHYSTVRGQRPVKFAMTFYSYVFPNTALTSATFSIARALNNRPIAILGCVMTCLLICAWITVFSLMVRAVVVKDILWPQKQEDRAEGGWKVHPDEKRACGPECEIGDVVSGRTEASAVAPESSDGARDDVGEGRGEKSSGYGSTGMSTSSAAERYVDAMTRGLAAGKRTAEDMV